MPSPQGANDSGAEEPTPTTFNEVVRIMVSYDMGWSKRGSGRNYDSLNGYGAIVGNLSGKVLDYQQCNRKCKACDLGNAPSSHDCRVNYYGSAKGMEPHTAENLVSKSSILQSHNLQVGVLIGDDDSSTIAACRAAVDHEIVKQSDMNHASKGVKKTLYAIQKSHAEINGETIMYLHRCFTYALSQNRGKSTAMATAIRAIPLHIYNDHTICGDWCGYRRDPENYDHRIIPGGLTDPDLKEALIDVFNRLANNASKFSAGASSNTNESLNSMMSRKCPKTICYSMSASADFRFSAVIGKKNVGEGYTQKAAEVYDKLSPGSPFLSTFVERTDKLTSRKRLEYNDPKVKANRIRRVKNRNALKNRREEKEGTTYSSQMGLLEEDGLGVLPSVDEENVDDEGLGGEGLGGEGLGGEGLGGEVAEAVVMFDIETTGFDSNCDILQIGARFKDSKFNIFIKPTKTINKYATKATGLTSNSGDLYKHGKLVPTIPLQAAIPKFIAFLGSLKNSQVYLCAHSGNSFDFPRLYNSCERCHALDSFKSVVKGVIDTLPVIRKMRPNKPNNLKELAEEFGVQNINAHDAYADVVILMDILKKLGISFEELLQNSIDISTSIENYKEGKLLNRRVAALNMNKIVGDPILLKIAAANIVRRAMQEAAQVSLQDLTNLLVPARLANKTVQKLYDYFKNTTLKQAGPSYNTCAVPNVVIEPPQPPAEREPTPDLLLEYFPPDSDLQVSQELTFQQL